MVDLVLKSNPNFNYLYSNYSEEYYEPLSIFIGDSLPRSLLNTLYGSNLAFIDSNRYTNQVNNPAWVQKQMCFNNKTVEYFFKGSDQEQLRTYLCNELNSTNLTDLFVLLSEQIDFSLVKKIISNATFDDKFFAESVEIMQAATEIKENFLKSNMTTLDDLFTKVKEFKLSDICDSGSQLNIFTLVEQLDIKELKKKATEEVMNSLSFRSLHNNKKLNTTQETSIDSLINQLKQANSLKSYKCAPDENCFCKNLFTSIEDKSEASRSFLAMLKPLIVGKILYAPNNSLAINKLIERVNTTFSNIHLISDLFQELSQTSQKMYSFLEETTNSSQNDLLINITQGLKLSFEFSQLASSLIRCYDVNKFIGFSTEKEAVDYGSQLMDSKTFWAAIIFQNISTNLNTLPKIVNYKIRMDSTHTHDTAFKQDPSSPIGPPTCQTCNKYFLYGFIYIQDMLEKAIVEIKTNQTYDMGVSAQMTPSPCWIKDKFITKIIYFLPLFMSLSWIFFVSMTVKDIVQEKEKRLKEFMRVMGLSNMVHWLAWFITSFLVMFFISCLLCIIIKYGKIMTFSDITVLITFFGCFTVATVTQCFLISVFFNKANLAAVVGGILYFTLYLPFPMLVQYANVLQPVHKMLFSLSSTVAFGFGIEIVGVLELEETGAQWSTFNKAPAHLANSLTLFQVCLILLFDALIYTVLTLYIECIAPGEYGIAKPWYFIFNPFSLKQKRLFSNSKQRIILEEEAKKSETPSDSIENVDNSLKVGIEIEKLNKVFSRGNNHALKGLSLKFYQNEITAFLGHNGAGKSTTMHILTGLYMPTTGTAKINGLSITKTMTEIRKSLGFVPQHNILFDLMTVREHIWFYSRLKGLDNLSALDEMKQMLHDTGLEPKRNELSKNLSGGMQRKLSVAIAFVGGSKTVILDEPSAGVDPSGRRDIWDMLLKYRKTDRTIIISTHHMDEADVLGDRIAIISNGKLIAHGTAYFLKQKFGRGYYLTIAKKEPIDQLIDSESDDSNSRRGSVSSDSGARSLSSLSDETSEHNSEVESEHCLTTKQDIQLYQFVKKRFRNAILIENIGSEMTFSVSNQLEFTKNYEKYFNQIESNMPNLGIGSMGISDTTLEEIFIKLANEPRSNSFKKEEFKLFNLINLSSFKQKNLPSWLTPKKESKKLDKKELDQYSKYTKLRVDGRLSLILIQFYALFVKRCQRVRRNVKGFFAEIVLPVVFVCLALLVATLKPSQSLDVDRPSLELHPWYYSMPNQMFFSKSSAYDYSVPSYYNSTFYTENVNPSKQPNIDSINQITETFFQNASVGARCVNGHKINKLKCESYNFKKLNKSQIADELVIKQFNAYNYSITKISPSCTCFPRFPFYKCEKGAGGDYNLRPRYGLKTRDVLFDLTSRNLTDWIIKTENSDQFYNNRYGGFEFLKPTDNNLMENLFKGLNMLTNIKFKGTNPISSRQNVKIWYNLKGHVSSVSHLNVINNAILRSKINMINKNNLSKEYIDPTEHAIVAFNHPMKYTKSQFLSKIQDQSMTDLFVAICIIFALSFIPASFLVFILEERENQSKQLQFVSGVKPYIYWITNYLLDLINYLVPCILCIFVFLIFDVKTYISNENFPCLVALILLYGWSSIPLMYPLNYLFKVASTAFVVTSCLNIFIGLVTVMTINVLRQLSVDEPYLLEVHDALKPLFIVLFPHFCLGQGFIQMSYLFNMAEFKREYGMNAEYDPFEFNNNGRNLLAMFLQGCVYFSLNILIQYNFFIRFKPEDDIKNLNSQNNELEDEDVVNEKNRIKNDKTDNDYVKLINLTKIYKGLDFKKLKFKKHVAVNNLCLGIQRGECFGLIGINGAGKTTTFKMITGELGITGGDVYIDGLSVSKEIEKVHKNIGYCPQFDAIMPLLTAREHLVFFARLRGIPQKYVKQVSEWAMNRVGLEVYADRISGDFSGGNKRKLSTAIALIGDPSVIILDEPTSGMDAKARRLLWNDILSLIKENRIVILTSHSMEECEALCTRLVIMVNGKFKCLGSPQHLRSKFGSGIKLAVRLNDEADKAKLFVFVKENFINSSMQESHKNLFEFIIINVKLSEIFGKLERNRVDLNIKDYSVNQTTLDQIFVNFAREEKNDAIVNSSILDQNDIEMEQL